MATSNSSIIGVNLQGDSDGATALFGLGSHVIGTNDTEWIYVYANAALTTGQCVTVNSGNTALLSTTTQALNGMDLAFSQGAFSAGDFGWVCKGGNPIYVLISSVSTVAGSLGIADNSGTLSASTVSGGLRGIAVITAAATATAVVVQAYVRWPKIALTLIGLGPG